MPLTFRYVHFAEAVARQKRLIRLLLLHISWSAKNWSYHCGLETLYWTTITLCYFLWISAIRSLLQLITRSNCWSTQPPLAAIDWKNWRYWVLHQLSLSQILLLACLTLCAVIVLLTFWLQTLHIWCWVTKSAVFSIRCPTVLRRPLWRDYRNLFLQAFFSRAKHSSLSILPSVVSVSRVIRESTHSQRSLRLLALWLLLARLRGCLRPLLSTLHSNFHSLVVEHTFEFVEVFVNFFDDLVLCGATCASISMPWLDRRAKRKVC